MLKELRSILAPECAARAREISTRMTRPTAAVTAAADLLEATARQTPGSTPSSSPGR
ncbi:glycosyltransferase [Mycobacterium tuberculosis]|nr:glycosyltransferase [Mycobacterium tuberculosis]